MEDKYNFLLRPLLSALGWKGEERHIDEALSDRNQSLDLEGFRDVMVHLGYASILRDVPGSKITENFLPLIVIENGNPRLVRSKDEVPENRECFVLFQPAALPVAPENGVISVRHELRRFEPILRQVVVISLLVGVLALAPIYFNRAIYDHVIASGSSRGLPMIVTGAFLAMAAELFLRHMRNQRLAMFGGRVDHFVSCTVFERLMFLPPIYTERVAVSAQLARLRDFENVREFFTGPLATLFFEMPLVLIYLLVMGFMTEWLVLVPILLLGAYAILLALMRGRLKISSAESATAASQRQEMLLETVGKLHAIRLAGMEDVWQDRYRQISGRASLASFHAVYNAQVLETCSYILMSLGGISTLGFGVIAVIEGHLTTGELIAAMMLVWRIIAPMQICCASITRLQQLKNSIAQVKRLLSFPPEKNPYKPVTDSLKPKGRITFHRVSLRYTPEMEPSLLGVSFDVMPGQVVAIRGANGSGKSSILKLILGLYQPQNGNIRLDGIDIRQFDPVLLRQSISYIPQNVDLFPGTIRENMLFAAPDADDARIRKALGEACALDEVERLPLGLDTRIDGEHSDSISFMLSHRLNLARAYLRPAPIMLFDEASHSLGKDNDDAFIRKLNELRGKSTIILVTHREDHMRLADTLLVIDRGELTHAGPTEQVMTVLKGRR